MRVAFIACLTLLAGETRAQGVTAALDDLRLATAVQLALAANPVTAPAIARVTARAGAVVVAADWHSAEAEARAASVAGAVPGVASIAIGDGPALPAAALGAGGAAEPDEAPSPESEVSSEPEPVVEPVRAEAPTTMPAPLRAEPAASTARPIETHVVRLGDTLFSIARRYGTTVQELQRLNGLGDSTDIALGRSLVVR